MATVVDVSGNNPIDTNHVDDKLEHPTRYNAGDPTGSLTPAFSGELVMDTTNEILYRADGLTNTSWTRV